MRRRLGESSYTSEQREKAILLQKLELQRAEIERKLRMLRGECASTAGSGASVSTVPPSTSSSSFSEPTTTQYPLNPIVDEGAGLLLSDLMINFRVDNETGNTIFTATTHGYNRILARFGLNASASKEQVSEVIGALSISQLGSSFPGHGGYLYVITLPGAVSKADIVRNYLAVAPLATPVAPPAAPVARTRFGL